MSQPKRILYVHHAHILSGATLSLVCLIQHLDRSRFTPVVCLTQEGEVEELFATQDVEVRECPMARFSHTTSAWWPLYKPPSAIKFGRWVAQYPAACRRLENVIEEVVPDLVHLNSLTLAPYAPVFSRQGVPVVVHVRESVMDGWFGVRKHWLRRLLIEHADAIIYICEDNRNRLTGAHSKGQVIYNPVDFSKFDRSLDRETVRRDLGIPDQSKVVLFVGGGIAIKGVMPFIEAMKQVLESVPDLYCLMPFTRYTPSTAPFRVLVRRMANLMGVYSTAQQVERMLADSAIAHRVLRTSFRLDIEKFFAASDVVVVPFLEPHFARPVIEAAAMAKAVVASRIGGIEEVVADGETGLLVPPGDVSALATATTRVLQDRALAERMGEAGYQKALRNYSASVHAEQVTALYRQLGV